MAHELGRIALVSTYNHLSRNSMEQMLKAGFPEYEVDNFSVDQIVKSHWFWFPRNLWYVAKECGRELLRGQTAPRHAFFRTTHTFGRLRAAMQQHIRPDRHLFSFQMQSLYNTSVPGVPHFVYTDHTHLSNLNYSDFDRRHLRSPQWIELERSIYDNATVVFTRSTDIQADLIKYYGIPAEKIECVYAGSNVDVKNAGEPDNNGYSNRQILFVGVDWLRKGGAELTRAFRTVLESHPDAQLVIAGSATPVDLPNCRVLGNVNASELSRYYSQSSIFCLPTKREPFGIAFVEAMMHRLPIVGTRVGAVPDMVEDGVNGFLVEPGQSDTLARVLCTLLDSPELCRQFGQRSHERAVERYTWAGTGQRIRSRILKELGLAADTRLTA
ncbi:MAG: glycosyltransferase [Proteobacteria bacterium]|nr:glycosyltransferase [Pseudomonadota bacterium]